MKKNLPWGLLLALLLTTGAGWSKTLVGQTVSASVTLESGDVFALPDGNWEVLDALSYNDSHATTFETLVLKNGNPEAAMPLIVIRQTARTTRANKTTCDFDEGSLLPNERFGTKSSDLATRCARMWKLGPYAQWLQSRYARDEPWWKPVTQKFPDLGTAGNEPMVLGEFQLTQLNRRLLQFEVFVRTAQLGITPNTVQQEASRGLNQPIHQALREWQKTMVEAAEASVFDGKPQTQVALEEIYARHGLRDGSAPAAVAETRSATPPAATGFNLEAQPANSTRWLNDPSDAAAQAKLGWQYRGGDGVPRDMLHAYELFRRAAEQGDSGGWQGLAWMYLEGLEGLPQNEAKGFELMQKATAMGNPFAMADLGLLYQDARGVAKSDPVAISMYRQSIKDGARWGAMYLARSYRDGRGVPKDEAEAAYWFGRAADKGLTKARAELAALSPASRSAASARLAAETGATTAAPGTALANNSAATPAPATQTAALAPATPPAPALAPAPAAASTAASTAASRAQAARLASATPHRLALVIGNDQYQNVNKLLNARSDARALSAELTRLGFRVTTLLDLNEREMKQAVRDFKARVEGGDEVLFYYAGHGVQLGNTNYLLPVDIKGENEEQVRDEAIQLQRVLDDMQDKHAKFTLAVIDACRDNPFKSSGRAIGGRGLAPTTAATGQMIIFSAGTGQQALDKLGGNDKDPNSVFARTFIKEMDKPGITVDRVLRNVRNQVVEMARSVGHEQVPALYDQVVGDFYFRQ